jgi:hypothetical protein
MYTPKTGTILVVTTLAACTFCEEEEVSICGLIGGVPVRPLESADRSLVFEDPGAMIAYHGIGCALSDRPGQEEVIKIEDSIDLPPYAGSATIFLDGWDVRYRSSDHHVAAFGTAISGIRFEERTLKWLAAGAVSDENFDDGYEWCYSYTVIGWNPTAISLAVDHKDGCDDTDVSETNFFEARNKETNTAHQGEDTTTALSSFPTFVHTPSLASGKAIVIAPRGFGVGWLNRSVAGSCTDHHLLQTSYDFDHSELFVQNGKRYKKGTNTDTAAVPVPPNPPNGSQVDPNFVSWETSSVFKDNARRRDYAFGEIVSALGGNDVGVIQPPFSVLPVSAVSGCVSGPGPDIRKEEFVIKDIPYTYAVPLLTGWDLEYDCDDQHVKAMGVRIDEWDYDRSTGTLHYVLASRLRDKNGSPDFITRHKVSVLGIKPLVRRDTPS